MIALALLLQATALDRFDDPAPWRASASDGVAARLERTAGAIRLDYDFGRVSGYAFVTRALPIDFPAHYELRVRLRGAGGANDLQIKVTDASGDNVWWFRRDNYRPSAEWTTIRIRPQDLSFAWGPTADKTLRRTARVELVIARGRDGGAGRLEIDDLELEALPPPRPPPAPVASDARAVDGDAATAWRGRGGQSLVVDYGQVRALPGVSLRWRGPAPRYVVEASDDRRRWRTLRTVTEGDGGDDPLPLRGAEARYLRVSLPRGAASVSLAEIDVLPSADPNALIAALAKTAPRGAYPRGFTEQSYWTLVGPDGGPSSGLLGEDGAIEVAKGGFSIEPLVVADGRAFGWADVRASQSLEDGYLPLPHVGWAGAGWTLDTALFADGRALMARWRLTNTGATPRTLRLVLAVRPFQVNPPAQFLSQQGGVSPIASLRWDGARLSVTTPPAVEGDAPVTRALAPLKRPDAVGMAPFDRGASALAAALPARAALEDPAHLASATMTWQATLAPGEVLDVPMAIPFGADAPTDLDRAHAAVAARWRGTLGGVAIAVPPGKQAIADTVKTALAHVLMSRDGPALKPGTRSYDRSWVRDGAMMGDTLLRLGLPGPVRAFADWYGPAQFDNGKVPCCVDRRGADPVPENDSHGEYIHLLAQLHRYTGDRAALARDWPRLDAARRYMEGLRQSERKPANPPHLYGLMPPSISHEGYSTKAQYSLWDDFWALTGYKDAAYAARVLARPEAAEIERQRDQFAADLHAAIAASVGKFGIDFIPGATSLGDFDATSTTIALDPAGEEDRLDQRLLRNTFRRQYDSVVKRAATTDWDAYTPYELRNVSALVRLGWRGQANRLLDLYMADRRPAAWNGWAEVVGRDPREVRFIGDMPHAWVATDFIRAALDLFAYIDGDAVVLGAGLDRGWLEGKGAAMRGQRTPWGAVDLHMRIEGRTLVAEIGGGARPPGGFLLPWPLEGRPGRATVNGSPARFGRDGLRIPATGAPVRVQVAF